jgi:hypothetical protein
MKKTLVYALLMTVAGILLSACGSNSREDPLPAPTPPPGGYAFMNMETELEIDEYKTYPIRFQLVKDGFALPDAVVSMKVPDKSIGSIEEYNIKTDTNGEGTFIYTPPAIFPEKGNLHMVFSDGNITLKETIKLNFKLNTDIPSDGRATSLSISYETSECDETRGIIGHYHIHAVDRFSHVPIVNMPINVSLINGIRKINGQKVQLATGTIYNIDPVEFEDKSVNFFTQTKVKVGDNLIILPSEEKTDASYIGGWEIKEVSSYLQFKEYYYNLSDTMNLTYIVGSEKRLLGGENGTTGILANAHVEKNYTTDNDGYVYFDIVFDPILAGHTVTVEAHGDEDGNRIGIAMKTALRLDGDSFTAPDITIPNYGGLNVVRVPISINPTCSGTQPLIDVPVNPNSFQVTPAKNCFIVSGVSSYHTDGQGTVSIAVQTDGNVTAAENCELTWDGDITSLVYEY